MDKLWAPWRIGYIRKLKRQKGCLFCRILRSKDDGKNLVLWRTEHSLALLNLYPYNNGHLMVAPRRHKRTLELLSREEVCDLMEQVKRAKRLLDRALGPEGYNIGINIGRAAGAGYEQHLHVHIVPRWFGDVNFMPMLAETKIISQSLKDLYKTLKRKAR